jgi:hypothetical protein
MAVRRTVNALPSPAFEFDGKVSWGAGLMRMTLAEHGLMKIEQANSLLSR